MEKVISDVQTPSSRTIDKYRAAGWEAFSMPPNCTVDIIAKKSLRLHFIQIIAPGDEQNARFGGESKNNFVQNAFSNSAEPVYAYVQKTKVIIKNANTGASMRV